MKTQLADRPLFKAILLTTSILPVLAGATISPALPSLRDHFASAPNIALWARLLLTLPALFISFTAPLAGYLADRFGRKRLLSGSLLLYGLGGASPYLAAELWQVLLGRALLGIAVAGVMTTVTALIADYYQGPRRSAMLGLQAGFMGLGGTVFFGLGGFLAEIGWREPFLIYLLGFVAFPFILFIVSEPGKDQASVEEPYPLADPGSCVSEALCLEKGPPAESARGLRQLAIFIYGLMVLIHIVFYQIPVQLPFYLEEKAIGLAAESGTAISVMSLFYAAAALSFGRLYARLGRIPIMLLSLALMSAGYVLVWAAEGLGPVYLGMILSGSGLGLIAPQLVFWLSDSAAPAVRGRLLGGLTSAIFFGQFLSSPIGGYISLAVGIGATYLLMGGFLLILAAALFLGRRQVLGLGVGAVG